MSLSKPVCLIAAGLLGTALTLGAASAMAQDEPADSVRLVAGIDTKATPPPVDGDAKRLPPPDKEGKHPGPPPDKDGKHPGPPPDKDGKHPGPPPDKKDA